MAVESIDDILTAKTADELTTELLASHTAEGLPVTAWQTGNPLRTMTKADATALADLHTTVGSIGAAAFLDDAEGDWLTLLAASKFDLTRTAGVACEGYVTLTVTAGAGPYSISPGGLLVSDGVRRWRSIDDASGTTVTSAASVLVKVQAEAVGTAYNVAAGTITTLITPASAGLSVSNPVPSGLTTWITTAGAAEETDASLRQRCRDRWGTLGRGANDTAYRYWARTGHAYEAQVTRAVVVWGVGNGALTIYIAGPANAITDSAIVSAVQANVDTNKPGTDNATVTAATGVTVTIDATIRVRAASDSTANRALATDAVAAYFASLDIGDDVDLGALYDACYAARGVVDVDITSPSSDTSINNNEIAVPSLSVTWVLV